MGNNLCRNCENKISDDFDFCPFCGSLFVEGERCKNHPGRDGDGVCLICENVFCKGCGRFVNGKFLCNEHDHYEIYQGMAKVYGSNDNVHCNYLADILKQEGINALVYVRKTSPISIGGVDYSLFRASGEYNGHLINEVKVMVPLSELLAAEKIVREFEIE